MPEYRCWVWVERSESYTIEADSPEEARREAEVRARATHGDAFHYDCDKVEESEDAEA